MNRWVLGIWTSAVALGLAWALLIWQPTAENGGISLDAGSPKGGDFRLQSAAGPLALEDLRGKVVVLYFGYTFCPDICPTGLALLSAALEQMEPGELAQVQSLFVSVDPDRDDLQRLAEYAAFFHPGILGLTGNPVELTAVAARYGAVYRKVEQKESAAGYLIDHSAFTYVIDRSGQLAHSLPHGTSPERILAVLRQELAH